MPRRNNSELSRASDGSSATTVPKQERIFTSSDAAVVSRDMCDTNGHTLDVGFAATSTFSSSTPSAPASARAMSPSPLAWSDADWAPGHFSFALDDDGQLVPHTRVNFSEGDDLTPGNESATQSGGDLGLADRREPLHDISNGAGSKFGHSRLTPTAAPFVFSPKHDDDAAKPGRDHRSKQLEPLITSFPLPPTSSVPYTAPESSSPVSVRYSSSASSLVDYRRSSIAEEVYDDGNDWHINEQGRLVSAGAGAGYDIAEEILQIQDRAVVENQEPPPPPRMTTTEGYGGRVYTKIPENRMSRRSSEPFPTLSTRQSLPHLPLGGGDRQRSSTSSGLSELPPTPSAYLDRARSQSFGGESSYFSRSRSSSVYSLSAAAQLSSYFGPSPVDVNFTPAFEPPAPSAPLEAIQDLSDLAGVQLQTDPEDILYTEARETFIAQSFSALGAAAPSQTSRQAMLAHFDRAMHSSHPLAMLYGLTHEAANALAADPKRSGVSDNVLKLALIRGQQTKAAGPGGLAGPSANNRKLGLYKTELCRSWEEMGSCRYGTKCQFAHGAQELREVQRHPKFKSEVCRTFWLHGSCPYGRRCCFIHTTIPGGASSHGSVQPPATTDLVPASPALSKSSSSSSISRLMMTRSSSSGSLGALAASPSGRFTPQRGSFGPNLADYLGPSVTSSPSSRSSLQSSPVSQRNSSTLYDQPGEPPLIGLGLKPPGRFTSNPGEVPPMYQEPPKSRLERLASMSNPAPPRSASRLGFGLGLGGSSLDMAAQYFGSSLFGPVQSSPFPSTQINAVDLNAGAAMCDPNHTRSSSMSSYSSIWSSNEVGTPELARTASLSSLSSISQGGSSPMPFTTCAPLQPVAGDWLGNASRGPTTSCAESKLEWPSMHGEEDTEKDDDSVVETHFLNHLHDSATSSSADDSHYHQDADFSAANIAQHNSIADGLSRLSFNIDRSTDLTPVGAK